MNKMLIWVFVLIFSLAFVYAEGGNSSNGSNDNECTLDADCDIDEVCIDNECEDVGEELNETDYECTLDTDCDNNEVCVDNECEDSGNGLNDNDDETEVECTLDTECDAGEVCLNGECEDAEDETEDEIETEIEDEDESEDDDNITRQWKECFDDSTTREVSEIALRLRAAERQGNVEKVAELKQKMQEITTQIREQTMECQRARNINLGYYVSQAVKDKNGSAADIVEYYKMMLANISQEENLTLRIEALKQLRSEIDNKIINLVRERKELNTADMEDIVERIELHKGKIKTDDLEMDTDNQTIITQFKNKQVEILIENNRLKLKAEGVELTADDIVIENDTLYIKGHAISLLPSEAAERYKIRAKEVVMDEYESKTVYKIKYEQKRKILGLFKTTAEKEAKIDINDGNKLEDKGPWWQWMSTNDGSADTTADTE